MLKLKLQLFIVPFHSLLELQEFHPHIVLVVDDFGIKYISKDDLDQHLISTLEKYYEVSVDLDGKEFVKIELDWDYENKRVHLSMAPYLQKALHREKQAAGCADASRKSHR